MSDIHGCINEFKYALSLVEPYLSSDNAKLILLGDYFHRGAEGYAVVELIMSLREKYGEDKCIALMGNHEEMACDGTVTESGIIPVLLVDTDTDKYYRVLESGMQIIFPY